MRAVRLCTVCGVLTGRAGSRCAEHARQSNRSRHNALYGTRAWQRLGSRVLRSWRGEHGDWCPGYERAAHRASDLTVDHVVPLAAGGARFDIANCSVLCRSCNSTKGASTDRGGGAHVATPMPADRAARLCSLGRVSRSIPGAESDSDDPHEPARKRLGPEPPGARRDPASCPVASPPVSDDLWARVEAVRRAKTRGGGPRHRGRRDLLAGQLVRSCGRRIRSDGRMGNTRPRRERCTRTRAPRGARRLASVPRRGRCRSSPNGGR